MKGAILAMFGLVVMALGVPAAAQLERITDREAVAGLRAALEKGSQAAVGRLGRADGFLGDPKVKIPLPESLTRAESVMRRLGMGKYADELVVAMNRAAEEAVPEARQIFVDSVRKMTIRDAKGILTGGETAGTEYFRRTTEQALHGRFLPIVSKATARVGVAEKYHQYGEKAARVGLLKKEDADLDEYVTKRALDALYLTVAEEEKQIRKDPVGAGTSIIRKVFGALR